MTLTTSLKKTAHMLPLVFMIAANANADPSTQLERGCRDKDQISKELEADNQGTLVKFFIDGRERGAKDSKWVEVFYTSDIKTGNGYRLERSGNDKMCVVATTSQTKLFNNVSFDESALVDEAALYEIRLQIRRTEWDAKTREFGGRQLTHKQIDHFYDRYLRKENHNKILEEYKSDGMTETRARDTLDKMTQRASLWAEMKKLEVDQAALGVSRLQIRQAEWDAKTSEFGGRQLTHRQIDKIYDRYLKNENHSKILEEFKSDGMTDIQARDTLDKMTQRASFWAEMKKLEVEGPEGINKRFIFNELILELSQSAKFNPMIRTVEYDLNRKLNYITILSGHPNSGKAVQFASTLDGEWIKDYRVNVPSTTDAPHGAEYTKYSKSLLGIADTNTKVSSPQ